MRSPKLWLFASIAFATAVVLASAPFAAQAPAGSTLDARASDPVTMGWMVGAPPPQDKLIRFSDGSWFQFPQTRWSLSNIRQLMPTSVVRRGPIAEDHAEAEEENVRRRLLPGEREQIAAWEKRKMKEPTRAFGEIQRIMVPAYYYDRRKSEDTPNYMTQDTNIEVMRLGYQPAFGSLEKFIRSRLSAIKAPVLLVHGRQDAVTEGGVVEAHYLIKRSQLQLISRSGHMLWIEQPEQCWKVIHEFLDSLQNQPPRR